MACPAFSQQAVTFTACFNFRDLGGCPIAGAGGCPAAGVDVRRHSLPSVLAMEAATIEGFLAELRARHGSVRAFLEAARASPAALDRLVADLVVRELRIDA